MEDAIQTSASPASPAASLRPWLLLLTVSLASFWVNAGAFTTLGVLLPRMIREMGWGWTEAGLGFTILGAAVGLSSYFPRYLIRRHGVRAALIVGTLVMASGFASLGAVRGGSGCSISERHCAGSAIR